MTAFTGTVTAKSGRVTARYPDGQTKQAALADVKVILVGTGSTLSAAAMVHIGSYGIPTIVCDWRSVPVVSALPWSEHSTVGRRQRQQREMSEPRRKQAWKKVVRAKVRGQANVLRAAGNDQGADALYALSRTVRSGDTGNIEATAARRYWTELFGPGFVRTPGGGGEVNSMLNYGYTVLRGAVLREVVAAGLWPAAGVFHSNLRNPFGLVDDLIEPSRPAVDHLCWTLYWRQARIEDSDTRRVLAGVLDTVHDTASGTTVGTAVTRCAQSYGMYVEDGAKFDPLPWSGPGDEETQ